MVSFGFIAAARSYAFDADRGLLRLTSEASAAGIVDFRTDNAVGTDITSR